MHPLTREEREQCLCSLPQPARSVPYYQSKSVVLNESILTGLKMTFTLALFLQDGESTRLCRGELHKIFAIIKMIRCIHTSLLVLNRS